jgi:hypothetical protein
MDATQAEWRQPGRMLVMDTESGRTIVTLDAGGGAEEPTKCFLIPRVNAPTLRDMKGIANIWKELDPTITGLLGQSKAVGMGKHLCSCLN